MRVNLETGHVMSSEESHAVDIANNDKAVKELIAKLVKEGRPATKVRGEYFEALTPLQALQAARRAHDARHHKLFDKAIAPLEAAQEAAEAAEAAKAADAAGKEEE